MKIDLQEVPHSQKWCQKCGGLLRLVVNGMVKPPSTWGKYNLRSQAEIGCKCKTGV